MALLTSARPRSAPGAPAPRVLTVAHRGASHDAPENTLAAVRRAVEQGADLVEVDVQRTRDGALVLMHDETVRRTTDAARVLPAARSWRVADLTLAEVRRLDAGAWKGTIHAGAGVPTLTEVFTALEGTGCGLLLELKAPGSHPGIVADLAAEIVGSAGSAAEAVRRGLVVQSFDAAAMEELKTRLPELRISLLGRPDRAVLPTLATWAEQVNPGHRRLTTDYVAELRAHGLGCLTWTVDSAAGMRRAVRKGVDGVITNRPDLFARILADTGAAA